MYSLYSNMEGIRKIKLEHPEISIRVKLESSDENSWVNPAANNDEEYPSMSHLRPLLNNDSIKPEINTDFVGPYPVDSQMKVEKLEEIKEGRDRETDEPDFSSDTEYTTLSAVKLENLPEAPKDFFPITPDVEIDIKDEFNCWVPLLETLKTEETPVEPLHFQNQSVMKLGTSHNLGHGSGSKTDVEKPRKKNARIVEDPVASKHVCQQCKSSFSRKEYLKRHLLYHCENGHVQGPQKNSYDVPHGYYDRNMPSTSMQPQCKECGKYFSRPDCVKKHFARIHLNSKKSSRKPEATNGQSKALLACSHCRKTFKHKDRLNMHLKYHSNINARKCNVCGEAFGDSYTFNRHMRWAHYTPSPPRKCADCGRLFDRSYDLKRHQARKRAAGFCPPGNLRKEPGEKVKYSCEHCWYFSFSKKTLSRHLQLRKRFCIFPTPKDRPNKSAERVEYTCDHCGYCSFQKRSLARHLQLRRRLCVFGPVKRSPTLKVEYKCEYCGSAFLRKDKLKDHLKRRLQKPNAFCQSCCKNFRDPEKLREHVVFVHESKVELSVTDRGKSETSPVNESVAFVCEPCGLSFKRRGMFSRHVLRHHKNV